MISVSSKSLKNISKVIIIGLLIYSALYLAGTLKDYYDAYKEKERLTNELQFKRDETTLVKQRINKTKENIEKVENSYLKQEEVEIKVKEIFKRVSLLDYQIDFLDSKKMCIDRYILISRISYESDNGRQAATGILNFLGKSLQSDSDENLYFVDYIAKPKDMK